MQKKWKNNEINNNKKMRRKKKKKRKKKNVKDSKRSQSFEYLLNTVAVYDNHIFEIYTFVRFGWST